MANTFSKRITRDVFYHDKASGRYVTKRGDFMLTIDCDAIVAAIASRAATNKNRKALEIGGAIELECLKLESE